MSEEKTKRVRVDKLYDEVKERMANDSEFKEKIYDSVKGEIDLTKVNGSTEKEEELDQEKVAEALAYNAKALFQNETPEQVHEKTEDSRVSKDVLADDFSNAGLTVPTPLGEELIDILSSEPVFMDEGDPMVMDMPEGKMDLGRLGQRPSANWQGETDSISESDTDFEKLQLDSEKLTVKMEISNDFLRAPGRVGSEYFMEEMRQAAANKLDKTFIEGTGGAYEPVGVRGQVDSDHINASNGNSISNILKDLKVAKRKMSEDDVPQNNLRLFMRPEVRDDLLFDINANEDEMIFRQGVANGNLMGIPFSTTTNITLESGPDTDIYLVDMSEVIVGRTYDFTLSMSRHEKFSNDLSVLKLVSKWDLQMRHPDSAAVINNYSLQ